MPEIITRAEAKALGLKRYFTGKPCKHGHVCERYVDNKTCARCIREKARKYLAANRERLREEKRKRYAANPERGREGRGKWKAANPDKMRECRRKYAEATRESGRERRREGGRKRYAANPEKYREELRQRYWAFPEGARERVRLYAIEKTIINKALIEIAELNGLIEKGASWKEKQLFLKAFKLLEKQTNEEFKKWLKLIAA
jgi:hypothetical protein